MTPKASIYLVTRVHGLRTHLITQQDIKILAKARSIREISDSLMKTDYAPELGQLPTEELDAATLEVIFPSKLVQRSFFVRRTAQGVMRDLIDRYCARFEIENIKRILRAKHGLSTEEPSLIPVPREESLVNFPALVKAKDIDEAISLLRDTPYHSLVDRLQAYRESGTSLILEASLDRIYFAKVWELARKIPGIRELIGTEIDLRNLLITFALKNSGASSRLIEETLIPLSFRLPSPMLHSVVQSRLEDAPNLLTGDYARLAGEALSLLRTDSAARLDWLFSRELYVYASTVLVARSLQAGYVLAYLLLCEREERNLLSIVMGKQLKLSEEEISKGLFGF
jgi:vacuolar-type H+-ATPase subunit C/Vma6